MTKLIKRLDLRRSGGRSITSGVVTTLAFSGRRRGVYKSIVEVNGPGPRITRHCSAASGPSARKRRDRDAHVAAR